MQPSGRPSVKLPVQKQDLSGYLGVASDVKNLSPFGIWVEAQCTSEKPGAGSYGYLKRDKSLLWLEEGESGILYIWLWGPTGLNFPISYVRDAVMERTIRLDLLIFVTGRIRKLSERPAKSDIIFFFTVPQASWRLEWGRNPGKIFFRLSKCVRGSTGLNNCLFARQSLETNVLQVIQESQGKPAQP